MVQNGFLGSSHPTHIPPSSSKKDELVSFLKGHLLEATPTTVAYLSLASLQSHGHSKMQGRLGNVVFTPGSQCQAKLRTSVAEE